MPVKRCSMWGLLSILFISLCPFTAANAASTGVGFVQSIANTTQVPAFSYALSFSSNTGPGDFILVGFGYDTSVTPSSVTDSQGNVFHPVGNQLTSPGGVRSRVYWAKKIKGGPDTVTVKLSANSSRIELYLTEYSGVSTTEPIDTQTGASGKAGAVSSGDAKTFVADDLIYGYCVGDSGCQAGSGFTTLSSFGANLIEDKLAGNPGVYAARGSANSGWTMQMVALRPASPVAVAMPVITSPATATAKAETAFQYQITATNSPTSYGATGLPSGLSVNSEAGSISGTVAKAGTSTVTLSATNPAGTANALLALTVSSASGALTISTSSLPNGQTGTLYSATLVASGGTAPYAWSLITGALPAGLSLNTSSGTVAGTPTQSVTNAPLGFEVTDSSKPALTSTANLALTVANGDPPSGQLMARSSNGRYLINSSTGQPVFVVGDDAFDLCCMLDSADVTTYLDDRASKGFNAIWMAAIDNGFSSNPPKNFNGNSPFDGADFTNFDASYWANIDSIIKQAGNLGITVFLNPFFPGNNEPGYLDSVQAASDATVSGYGTFLGNRYKGYNNIVWLLGGDSWPSTSGLYQKLDDAGAAIAAADPNHLITLEACEHCATNGYNSVQAYQAQSLAVPSWLTLNWAYPQYTTTVGAANAAYQQSPFLPPLCGENYYELTTGLTEANLRFEIYSEILSGCYVGRIFGNGAIWSFDSPNGGCCGGSPPPTWQSQLSSVGSVSQEYQGLLFRSREHWLLVPDISHAVVTAGYGSGTSMTTAARTGDGQTIIAYIPNGNATTITVNMAKITSSTNTVQGWWFNPQTGAVTNLGTFPNSGSQEFKAPDSNDWVLVLDDASANLTAPGGGSAN